MGGINRNASIKKNKFKKFKGRGYNPGSTNKYTKFGQLSGNSLKLLPSDVTDAPNSIPVFVCPSVYPSVS